VAGPHLDGKIIRKSPRRANESKRKARKPKWKTKNRKPNTKNNRQPNSTRSPANEVVKRGLENGMPLHLVLHLVFGVATNAVFNGVAVLLLPPPSGAQLACHFYGLFG